MNALYSSGLNSVDKSACEQNDKSVYRDKHESYWIRINFTFTFPSGRIFRGGIVNAMFSTASNHDGENVEFCQRRRSTRFFLQLIE